MPRTARGWTRRSAASWAAGSSDETYRIVRPDGSIRWIRGRAFPVRSAGGELERIVGTAADITSQRQLEEQFRQAQKMESVGRLAGGIAHDFNNLLTVINGTAELAALDLPRDATLRADLVQIRQAGDRAAALTRQLLAVSRRQILKPAVIDLTAIVRRHAEHAAPPDRRARRAGVRAAGRRWGMSKPTRARSNR